MSISTIFIKMGKRVFYRLPFSIQAYISKLVFRPEFGEDVYFGYGVKTYYGKCRFGRGCRVAGFSSYANVDVGNYSVFAEGTRFIFLVHNYDAFTINSGIQDMCGVEHGISEFEPRMTDYPQTVIGNDVWIGEYVTIMGGVHIGDGAIIATKSVVTHDVEPYSIVGGVPARFIKWRFDKETRDYLNKLKWWSKPKEWIKENYLALCNFDKSLL